MSYQIREQRIRLVQDRRVQYVANDRLENSEHVAMCARAMIGGEPREALLAFAVSASTRILGVHKISVGGHKSTGVSPRDVIQYAMLSNASALILAHNHPSGDPEPSNDDLLTTSALQQALRVVDVPLLDHVIVTPFDGPTVSFSQRGLL